MESTYLYDNDGTLRHDSTFPRGHAGRVIVGGLRAGRSVYRANAELPLQAERAPNNDANRPRRRDGSRRFIVDKH